MSESTDFVFHKSKVHMFASNCFIFLLFIIFFWDYEEPILTMFANKLDFIQEISWFIKQENNISPESQQWLLNKKKKMFF